MGIWDKFFGKSKTQKPKKSPFLPTEEDPLDIGFAKNFTRKGGRFLYIESKDLLLINFKEICVENNWESQQILSLNQTNSDLFSTSYVNVTSGNLKAYKAALIDCEYLISNTGKILLSENQIRHFKLSDLPETIIVKARMDQLVRDVSQGMTLLKNKYPKTIPTNITTLKIKSDPEEAEKAVTTSSTTSKSIYLLLEEK
jgi:hypothetical protein